jgi:Cu+-exporting ATPase
MTTDPVCGMQVDEKKAAATASYQNKTYYFCSAGCQKTFNANPAKYAGKTGGSQAGEHRH